MNKIETKVLDESSAPGGTMLFLAMLTQRGHAIGCMDDLVKMYEKCIITKAPAAEVVKRIAALPHGTIKSTKLVLTMFLRRCSTVTTLIKASL